MFFFKEKSHPSETYLLRISLREILYFKVFRKLFLQKKRKRILAMFFFKEKSYPTQNLPFKS